MDVEILTIEDVAEILKQDLASVSRLFEDGSLPGRKIGEAWYTTRRQLVQFVEDGLKAPAPPEKPVSRSIPVDLPPARRFPNAWTCSNCGAKNDAERVQCRTCRATRETPLMGYIPKH